MSLEGRFEGVEIGNAMEEEEAHLLRRMYQKFLSSAKHCPYPKSVACEMILSR